MQLSEERTFSAPGVREVLFDKPERDCLKALYREHGGEKVVAHLLDLKGTRVSNFASERSAERISYARVRQLTGPGRTAAARDLAIEAGGVFCALPTAKAGSPLLLTSEAMRQHTEAVTAIIDSHRDGAFTVPEALAAKKEIEEAMCALGALLGLCLVVLRQAR